MSAVDPGHSVNPKLEGEPRMSLEEAMAEYTRLEQEWEAAKARNSWIDMTNAREAMMALAREFGL